MLQFSYMKEIAHLRDVQSMTQEEIFFSIVMPTFNRAKTICAAIDSALAQTWKKFELIIVDDGSKDDTEQVISERYADELMCGKIRYFKQENAGPAVARNQALKMARMPYVAYLDSDNQMRRDFLEIFAHAIHRQRNETYYAQWERMSGKP